MTPKVVEAQQEAWRREIIDALAGAQGSFGEGQDKIMSTVALKTCSGVGR